MEVKNIMEEIEKIEKFVITAYDRYIDKDHPVVCELSIIDYKHKSREYRVRPLSIPKHVLPEERSGKDFEVITHENGLHGLAVQLFEKDRVGIFYLRGVISIVKVDIK
jgi:hypothetical protein